MEIFKVGIPKRVQCDVFRQPLEELRVFLKAFRLFPIHFGLPRDMENAVAVARWTTSVHGKFQLLGYADLLNEQFGIIGVWGHHFTLRDYLIPLIFGDSLDRQWKVDKYHGL